MEDGQRMYSQQGGLTNMSGNVLPQYNMGQDEPSDQRKQEIGD